jgi:hypothetical protein
MSQPPQGFCFRIDTMSGQFVSCATGSPGDGTVVVTGAPDLNAAATALNAGATLPTPFNQKFTVAYSALTDAIGGSTRAELLTYTYPY